MFTPRIQRLYSPQFVRHSPRFTNALFERSTSGPLRWVLLYFHVFEASDSPPACQEATRTKFLLCEILCVNPCSRCAGVCVGLDALDGRRDYEVAEAVQPLHVFCRLICVARPPRG